LALVSNYHYPVDPRSPRNMKPEALKYFSYSFIE
jgi:hypothetical protein